MKIFSINIFYRKLILKVSFFKISSKDLEYQRSLIGENMYTGYIFKTSDMNKMQI